MLLMILNVVYVLLAIAMVALVLMQRGAGAQAGSGFGAGASSTVFGSRGSSNFLSKSTKWLAITFFAISLFMAWYATQRSAPAPTDQDLGVMAQQPTAPAGTIPVAPGTAAPASTVPSAPADAAPAPSTTVPVAPQPAPAAVSAPQSTPPGG